MLRNVLALVALVIFGSLNTLTAESIDAASAAAEAVSADLAPTPKEEIKATNVIGDDELTSDDDEEEKISSSDERSFGLEEEDEEDFAD